MSSKIAIGAVAVLAGMAALSRRGSSNQARVGWRVNRVADLSRYSSWSDVVSHGVVLVSATATMPDGSKVGVDVTADGYGLDQYRSFAGAWIWDEKHAGGSDRTFLDKLQQHLAGFSRWLESLRYPLNLYRGVRLESQDELEIPGADVCEVENDHWSTFYEVARSFADGSHGDASVGSMGAVLTGVAPAPQPGDLGYVLDDYLRFSAGQALPPEQPGPRIHGQWEIGGVDESTIQVKEWTP